MLQYFIHSKKVKSFKVKRYKVYTKKKCSKIFSLYTSLIYIQSRLSLLTLKHFYPRGSVHYFLLTNNDERFACCIGKILLPTERSVNKSIKLNTWDKSWACYFNCLHSVT